MVNMAEKKILILGAAGMLGNDLAKEFQEYKPFLWDTAELDITDQQAVEEKISALSPDLIINAAAYTNVDGAEKDQAAAMRVNADAVGYIAKTADKIGAIVIHYSTEYVFDGEQEGGYAETSQVNPVNFYGKTKADGEERLIENCQMYYLIRTSWLYGHAPQKGKPRGMNFVDTMLKLAEEKNNISVVADQFGKPTFAKDLAHATRQLYENNSECGIYHLVNEGATNWAEFAKKIFEISGKLVMVNEISSEQYPTIAKRPRHAVLLNTKFQTLRTWQEALIDYLETK